MSKVVDKVKKTVADAKDKVMDVGDKAKDTVTGSSNDKYTTEQHTSYSSRGHWSL